MFQYSGDYQCAKLNQVQGDASVILSDDSIALNLSSHMARSATGFASITHDDFYSVPVNGPVSAVETLDYFNRLSR